MVANPISPTSANARRTAGTGIIEAAMSGTMSAGKISNIHALAECVSSTNRSDESISFGLFTADLLPTLHISNALFVARDHNFGALCERRTVVTARPASPARSCLRVDNLAGAVFADRHGDSSQHADHFIVGRVHILLVRDQHAG